ncbi:hypothetical protein [Chryseobacterium sp. EO14]|uniref:hypothetical protein n=1 Tax=Chryseobacterium sp. EO14 TaxID=2950551 RepID=UPI00210A7F9B|nr:hypothetical protein [Chryseobacterium sp. EO14]MCQ4142523.1 hypothetical protein [Chryseobacterium sp. EO14]
MKKRDLIYLVLILFATGFMLFLFLYFPKNENKFIIADIKTEIYGKIKKKVAVRKGLLTHAKISRYKKSDTLVLLGIENNKLVDIGDSILKHKNSPFFYILQKGKNPKKLKFVSISKSILNDKTFPKEWKDSCKTVWKSVVIDD